MNGFEATMIVLPIPGRPGYFAASDGTIWSSHRGRWGNRYADPHQMKTKPDRDGYLCVRLVDAQRRTKNFRVATLIARAFLGPRPAAMVVRHRNGVRDDNRPENLTYGTHTENVADRAAHGNTVRGQRSHLSKLTEIQALEILARLGAGESQASLARTYGVAESTVWELKTGRTWRHLTAVPES